MKAESIILIFLAALILEAADRIKVACVGNSITEGDYNYPSYLQKLLGNDYLVENEGVGGTTMLRNGDKPYWTQGLLSQALAFKPDIVIIKLGTNDTKPQNWDTHSGEYKTDYLAMIDTFQALSSDPDIFMVLPVPVFEDKWGIRNSIVKELLPIIEEIGAERNLPVIDANTPLLGFGQYFPDGVHPNGAGADTLAHVIYRVLIEKTPVARIYEAERAEVSVEEAYSISVPVRSLPGGVDPGGDRVINPAGRILSGGENSAAPRAVVPLIRRKEKRTGR